MAADKVAALLNLSEPRHEQALAVLIDRLASDALPGCRTLAAKLLHSGMKRMFIAEPWAWELLSRLRGDEDDLVSQTAWSQFVFDE